MKNKTYGIGDCFNGIILHYEPESGEWYSGARYSISFNLFRWSFSITLNTSQPTKALINRFKRSAKK